MIMSDKNRIQNHALCFAQAIEDVVKNDENDNYIEISNETVNAAIYRKELRDKIIVTKGAMILDGYEPEDSCIKFMNELIDEL